MDIYANRLRNLGKKIGLGMEENTLLYAFLSGFKPNLSSFVIGKKPKRSQKRLMQRGLQSQTLPMRPPRLQNSY